MTRSGRSRNAEYWEARSNAESLFIVVAAAYSHKRQGVSGIRRLIRRIMDWTPWSANSRRRTSAYFGPILLGSLRRRFKCDLRRSVSSARNDSVLPVYVLRRWRKLTLAIELPPNDER
jgi:hypothetical protein